MKHFLYLILFLPLYTFCQTNNDIISFRFGYGTTSLTVSNAYRQKVDLFGYNHKTAKTFSGDGFEFALSKELNSNYFIDLSFSKFSGKNNELLIGSYLGKYELSSSTSGFQIPLLLNYLVRNSSKKLRFNIGAGFHYLNAKIRQFETFTEYDVQTITETREHSISSLQLILKPGVQYRIIPNLYIVYAAKLGIPIKSDYNDNTNLSLRYSLRRKDANTY